MLENDSLSILLSASSCYIINDDFSFLAPVYWHYLGSAPGYLDGGAHTSEGLLNSHVWGLSYFCERLSVIHLGGTLALEGLAQAQFIRVIGNLARMHLQHIFTRWPHTRIAAGLELV